MSWQPLETAPKDRKILIGGRFRPFHPYGGGDWEQQIFSWSTIMSDGTGYQWIGPMFTTMDQWNVDWTHWHELPEEPEGE